MLMLVFLTASNVLQVFKKTVVNFRINLSSYAVNENFWTMIIFIIGQSSSLDPLLDAWMKLAQEKP